MTDKNRWLLPEGIEEVLPPEAWRLEHLRRDLLDLYRSWGYELVIPPFIEFLDSLQIGVGSDLDLKTFKLIDQLSGRLMGVRADMTPQVARIDAHKIQATGPNRLCYIGTVLHTVSDSFGNSRSPLQFGAEIYGHAGVQSDVEVLSLMLASLQLVGINQPQIDLGHVGIYRELSQIAAFSEDQEEQLFDVLQRKAKPEIQAFFESNQLAPEIRDMFLQLADLTGGFDTLERARKVLGPAGDAVTGALDNLQAVAEELQIAQPEVSIYFDLAELRGYRFHTGVVFAAYVSGRGQEVARGGRYDGIGAAFGNARPATGFSADLKALLQLKGSSISKAERGIFAPWPNNLETAGEIARLRQAGERVVCALPGDERDGKSLGCDRMLRQGSSGFEVVDLD